MPKTIDVFDKEYREACFYSWYSAGCPRGILSAIPEANDGRKPTLMTLQRWSRDDGWKERAEAMDAELSVMVDKDIIERKKQDYLELSETGRGLIKGAVDYLKAEGFDSASAAVRAIGLGAEMVAKYSQAAEMIESVVGKTDKQIEKEIFRLLGKNSDSEDIVEVEEEPKDEDADSDSEEDDNE